MSRDVHAIEEELRLDAELAVTTQLAHAVVTALQKLEQVITTSRREPAGVWFSGSGTVHQSLIDA
jgi:hypothetical protein